MKKLVLLPLMVVLLSGCMTQNKRLNITLRYLNDNPEFFAGKCADNFKPNTIYKPGAVQTIPGPVISVKGDSIPCPDGTKVASPPQQVQCPPSHKQVDTVTVENTARIEELELKLQKVSNDLAKEQGKNQELIKAIKGRNLLSVGLIIGIVTLIVLWIKFK